MWESGPRVAGGLSDISCVPRMHRAPFPKAYGVEQSNIHKPMREQDSSSPNSTRRKKISMRKIILSQLFPNGRESFILLTTTNILALQCRLYSPNVRQKMLKNKTTQSAGSEKRGIIVESSFRPSSVAAIYTVRYRGPKNAASTRCESGSFFFVTFFYDNGESYLAVVARRRQSVIR